MMEEQARVIEIGDGRVRIQAQRQSSCGHCSANNSCGTSVLSRHIGQRSLDMWVDDPIGVAVGDEVVIQLQEGGLLQGSLLIYLIPLLLMIVFALLGESLSTGLGLTSEGLVIAMSMLGLAVAFAWLRSQNKKMQHDRRYRPVIIRRLSAVSIANISVKHVL